MLNKLKNIIKNISGVGLALIFIAMCIQVFTRKVLNSPLYWSEEFGRFVFIYATWLGAYVAFAEDRMLTVDFILDYIPVSVKKAINYIYYPLTIFFLAVLFYQGIRYMVRCSGVVSAAMGIPMGVFYIIIPIASGLMIADLLINYKKHLLID